MPLDIPVSQLTEASLSGNGVFDVLMRAAKAHLDEEYTKNRIRGPEYSQVYLGSLTPILQASMQFLLEKQKSDLELELIQQQIELARNQVLNTIAERENIQLQALKLNAETAMLAAQTALVTAQQQNLDAERAQIVAKTAQTVQETANLVTANAVAANQRDLLAQQVINAATENDNMIKQGCKLQAEYDVLMEQKLKTLAETALLGQKNMTEKAQTIGLGVDDDSVIGKQKKLYEAQTNGFSRDAEQKAAKLMVDSWNVRRTTDEGTVADAVNMLNDATVGRMVTKMLEGVGA